MFTFFLTNQASVGNNWNHLMVRDFLVIRKLVNLSRGSVGYLVNFCETKGSLNPT